MRIKLRKRTGKGLDDVWLRVRCLESNCAALVEPRAVSERYTRGLRSSDRQFERQCSLSA